MYAELKAQGVRCSRRRVARLMRSAGLHGKRKRKYKTCSMSRKGDCFDNAAVESFVATLKRELVEGRTVGTRQEAELEVLAYIETFYNRARRHSAAGYLIPTEFERRQLVEERRVA